MLEIAIIDEGWPEGADWEAVGTRAATAAIGATRWAFLLDSDRSVEIAIRLTSDAEVQLLNCDYREKDKPTNVLSFPMLDEDERDGLTGADGPELLLGDLVLARGVCAAEAGERGIPVADHATHLIIHGVLHLLGFDHMEDDEARDMEALEQSVLRAMGLHDPYEDS